jgi:hypothetical protein
MMGHIWRYFGVLGQNIYEGKVQFGQKNNQKLIYFITTDYGENINCDYISFKPCLTTESSACGIAELFKPFVTEYLE